MNKQDRLEELNARFSLDKQRLDRRVADLERLKGFCDDDIKTAKARFEAQEREYREQIASLARD